MADLKLTQPIFDVICERLAEGRTLRSICRDDDIPVSDACVRQRVAKSEEWSSQYARARDQGLDAMADEMFDIIDNSENDWMQIETERGTVKEVTNHEHVTRSRARVDTRKWYLSKLAPKRYGDRITQDVTSSDGSLKGMSQDQIAHKLQAILDAAQKRAEAAQRAEQETDTDALVDELV